MTKDEEILLRELAGGRCTIQKVTAAIGPMSLWSKEGLEAEIRKAAQREWVGLTDEEAMQTWKGIIKYSQKEMRVKDFARAIEANLKEKNTSPPQQCKK